MPVLKDDVVHLRFGLTHHSHTGKKLHRSHTSWPLVTVMLLMVGVLLVTATMQVRAASIFVTARANGPIPDQAAVILSPKNGDTLNGGSVPVSGTCQAGFFVRLYRNEIFSGSTRCTPGGTFSIVTDLFTGRNDFVARSFNAADQEGPPSKYVTVYMVELGPPADTAIFYLSTEYFFKAAYSGQKLTWDFNIFGGSQPYTAYATWGDGYSDMITGIGRNGVTFEHHYNTQKDVQEYYNVTIRVVDASGRTAQLQLIAIMNDPTVISGALVRPTDPPVTFGSWFSGLLKGVWSVYGVVVLMGVCFFLGERRGFGLGERFAARRRARAA